QRLMGATQWSRQYQYDAAGQLTGIADNRSGQLSYRYDPVGRLLEAATPKGLESFRFDPAGNLLDNAPAADGHQDDSLLGNLLSQYAGRHYRYDSRGNLVEKRVNGSLSRLEWDSHNRLSRLIAPDGQRTDYHYDPLGRRIAKISQGQATLYGWDGDVLAFETRDEEAVHYLFEPDSFVPLAQVHTDAIHGVKVPAWSQHHPYDPDKDPLRQPAPEPEAPKAVYYYHTDHLGTPQALTDEHGALALEMDYQAWGQAREVIADAASKAGIRNPFRFQGQYHDDESGLHYNRYRYYDPEIGRFISRDPIGLMGGLNVHMYADNPILWIDPLGLNRFSRNSWGPCPNGRGTGLTYTVYQQEIDWNQKHNGITNLDRASDGGAPYIMKDGKLQQLQLHHSRQQSIGPLFEVTTSTHRAANGKGRQALHPYGSSKNPDYPVDRKAFDVDRKQYWKDRAEAAKGCKI
ncbi:RHS repeat-associated core domain-containing protein, partial [Chromobacterium violaceum]|uniref:RHS repeat-associated core domain-containing protein n=1 Tax=Chromobacterium violaceum TaxID=536 RepID=UPI001B33CC2E